MQSRMDRYYKHNNVQKRSIRNQELYKSIYDDAEYSNIEGITTIEKSNKIDINKIQELLKNRDSYKKEREVELTSDNNEFNSAFEKNEKERIYDIRDVLIKAKDNREETEENKKLRNTQYNILKNINLKEKLIEEEKGELKELINTITNNSMLSKVDDSELSLDLLNELKSGNTLAGNSKSINAILKEVMHEEQKNKEETEEIDKTFFTSSLNFKNDDFEELKSINTKLRKNNILIKTLMIILIIIIVMLSIFVVYNFIL